MKADEIMVGDWVLWKNRFVQIASVSGIVYSFGHVDVTLAHCNDDKLLETHDIKSISPIPLTPEILEKNGFENGKLNISPQYYLEDKDVFIGVTLKDIPDKHKGIDIAKGRLYFQLDISRMEEPLYVHQLQNALKLCGIEKSIEL